MELYNFTTHQYDTVQPGWLSSMTSEQLLDYIPVEGRALFRIYIHQGRDKVEAFQDVLERCTGGK